jgi:hypothetical protein
MAKVSVAITQPLSLETSNTKSWSAWSLSMALHLLVLLLLGLTIRVAPRGIVAEPDREAAIVLVERNADNQVSYFDQTDAEAAASAEQSPSEPQQSAAEAMQSALPPAEALSSLTLPDIALPGAEQIDVGSDQLIQVPSIRPIGRPQILPGLGDDAILADEAARNQGTGQTGPPAYVSVFGSPSVEGRSFVLLVDRSKSMGGDGLGALSAAASQFTAALAGLKPTHRFQIITYDQRSHYFNDQRDLLPASDENKQAALDYFKRVAAFGRTDHEIALLAALRLKPDVIFLLTDGGSPGLPDSQRRLITRRAGGRTSIHCIQFGFGPLQESENFMQALARDTDGSFRYINMNERLK